MKKGEYLIGFTALIIIAVALYFIMKYIFSFFTSINSQGVTTWVGITIPLVSTIVALFIGRHFENRKGQQEKIREHKIPVYNDLIETTLNYLSDKETKKEIKDKQLEDFFRRVTPKMVIWADDTVIKQWADFRMDAIKGADGRVLLRKLEDVMFIIRRDLGHENKNLNNHELLKCFLNDVDEFLSEAKK
ncbi:MAG TPA: hypothetical protein VN698_12040 [Bacteroidia bacterium]|nr:hypothetical protein [Bacteroidia bacterium]